MKRTTALVSAGIAAGVVAAGVVGRSAVRRRDERRALAMYDEEEMPAEDLGPVRSFDGSEITVRGTGPQDAPVLLFVHGFSLDMSTWSAQWTDLSRDHRVLLMDHRSHGASGPAAHGDLSLRAMGRDISAVLEAMVPDGPAIVVGHSMGGMAILALAEQRPELIGPKVAGVVLIGAASSAVSRGAIGMVAELLRPRSGSLAAAAQRVDRLRRAVLASPADVSAIVARVTQFGPNASPHLVDHIVGLAERTTSEVWTSGLPELMEMDLRHAVPRVTVPALVVVGEHDRVTPPASAVELAGSLPDGRLVVLADAGHVAMLEVPQELNREIRSFVKEVFPAARPRRRAASKKGGDR